MATKTAEYKAVDRNGNEMLVSEWDKFDVSKLKPGDKMVVTGTSYSMNNNDEWPDYSELAIVEIESIKGDIITLTNGVSYKQAYERQVINWSDGRKEVEISFEEYFKTTNRKKAEDSIHGEIYSPCDKIDSIFAPNFIFLYTKEMKNRIEKYKINQKKYYEIKAEEEKRAKQKKDFKQQYLDEYNAEVDPLREKLEALKKKISEQKYISFDAHFCQNCQSYKKHPGRCEAEVHWEHFPDENGMIKRDGERPYHSRPNENCDYFAPKTMDLSDTIDELIQKKVIYYSDEITYCSSYEKYASMERYKWARVNMLTKEEWEKVKEYDTVVHRRGI